MRRTISFAILAVYSIVIAHNFIPHHHHSKISEGTHYCKYDVQQNQAHQHEFTGNCCALHGHDDHGQNRCGFDDETILLKSTDLQDYFILASTIDLAETEDSSPLVSGIYIQNTFKAPPLGEGTLRGPPLFS